MGRTPAHLAAVAGRVSGVEGWVRRGGDVNVRDPCGWTPLHSACNEGHFAVVAALLALGADLLAKTEDHSIPLHYLVACDTIGAKRSEGGEEGTGVLIQMLEGLRAHVNTPNKYGETALHKAALKGTVKTVYYLLKWSAIDVNICNVKGETALCYAVRRPDASRLPLVKLLCDTGHADSTLHGMYGSPADLAKQVGHTDVLSILMQQNRDDGGANQERSTESELEEARTSHCVARKPRANRPLGLLRQEGTSAIIKVHLMARDGRFLAAKPSGEVVLATRNISLSPSIHCPECVLWQTWTVVLLPPSSGWEDEGGSFVGVQSWQGTYMRAYSDGNLFSEKGVVQDLDTFRMTFVRPNVVTLKAHHGRYLSSQSGRPRASAQSRDKWESWTVHYIDDLGVGRDWYGYAVDKEHEEAFKVFAQRYYGELLPQSRREWHRIAPSGAIDKEVAPDIALIKRGIPPEIRAEVWSKLSGVESKAKVSASSYAELVRGERLAGTALRDQIGRDTEQLLQGHAFLCRPSCRLTLRRVLSAYVVWDPVTPYCSYWVPIAGALLTMCSEEEAFWLLTKLISDIGKDYYAVGQVGLNVDSQMLERVLYILEEPLHSHLVSLGLPLVQIVSTWFLSLFTTCLAMDVLLRIWDLLFAEGPSVLVAVAFSLLRLSAPELIRIHHPNLLLLRIQNIVSMPTDPDVIIRMATEDFYKGICEHELNLSFMKHQGWGYRTADMALKMKHEDISLLLTKTNYRDTELEWLYSIYRDVLGEPSSYPEGISDYDFPEFLHKIVPESTAKIMIKPAFMQRLFELLDEEHTGALSFSTIALGVHPLLKGPLPAILALFFDTWSTEEEGKRLITVNTLPSVMASIWSVYPLPIPFAEDDTSLLHPCMPRGDEHWFSLENFVSWVGSSDPQLLATIQASVKN